MEAEIKTILAAFAEFVRTAPLPCCCPRCGGSRIKQKDVARRKISLLVAGLVRYLTGVPCRRVRCKDCDLCWRQRPPGIAPHKHFQLCVASEGVSAYLFEPDATLEEVADRCGCSRWTVSRWLGWLADIARPEDLQARLVEQAEAPIVAPVREVAELDRKAKDEGVKRTVLRKAARVLCHLEALALAAGLEPPGLRSVVLAVLRDRARLGTYARPRIPDFAHIGLLLA